jgi:neutral ceramidase
MPDLLAGATTVDITPPVGVMMDGYGDRTTPSQGVHDELTARILVLEQGDQSAAIVSCDLLGMHPWIVSEVRRRAADAHSISPDGVIIAATHDHAAPVGLRAGLFATLNEDAAETLVAKLADAIAIAWDGRRSARMSVAATNVDTISLNRRDPDWPVDPELRVVLLEGDDGPIASILNFACHATVLSGANLQLSGEFPGAAARLLQRETGAPCIYLNGACGDVNPAWIVQDFASVERAGQVVGGAALRLIAEMRAIGPGQRSHNIRWDEFPEVVPLGRAIDPSLRCARTEIEIPAREFEDNDAYTAKIEGAKAASGRDAAARVSRYEAERWASVWAKRSPTPTRSEVQAIRLGDSLAILALPGEFFAETAASIRSRTGLADLLVACYANDYLGYLVPAHAYGEGGYEPGITAYAPEAEAIVRDTATSLLSEVTDG